MFVLPASTTKNVPTRVFELMTKAVKSESLESVSIFQMKKGVEFGIVHRNWHSFFRNLLTEQSIGFLWNVESDAHTDLKEEHQPD